MMRRRGFVLSLMLALAMALALAGPGCTTNPATGKKQLILLNTQQEIALGAEAQPQFIKDYGGEVPSAAVTAYVRDLGNRLAQVSERPTLPWEFHVVDSQVINAFALPGGKVFISRGLLAKLEDESQVAGVLGHEVGHVTAQHVGQRMTQAMIAQGLAIGIGVAGEQADKDWLRVMGVGAQLGGTVYLLKFGRDQESQADSLGMRYMTRLGYNPVGQLRVMEILQRESSSGGRPPEFLSTHPYPATRIQRINAEIRKSYPDYQNVAKYKVNREAFKTTVLDNLAKLPPPKHTGQTARLDTDGTGGKAVAAAIEHPSLGR